MLRSRPLRLWIDVYKRQEYYLTPDFEAIKALSPEEFVRGIVENCHARALFLSLIHILRSNQK